MQYYFYDTCALLHYSEAIFSKGEKFYISNLVLKELEGIKTSTYKDENTKYQARKLGEKLTKFRHTGLYEEITYCNSWDTELEQHQTLPDTTDSRIIISALLSQTPERQYIFVSDDLYCAGLAESVGLTVDTLENKIQDEYTGYKIFTPKNDEELAHFYETTINSLDNFELKNHEYLLVQMGNQIIDKYIRNNDKLERLQDFITFNSLMFGEVKPKDDFQLIGMDSLRRNKITVLRGQAGTGKSWLAMTYLFNQIEKHKLDKIIIFCNPVATMGSAKLGFYPGSKDDKLLDSQIGNFLSSKLGDKSKVYDLIDDGTIVLLPMSDIRGYDTTGSHAGIYITEAQNMDIDLMKLALQRIGEDSVCILDGDDTAQVDLGIYGGMNNGLRRVSEIFRGEDIYGEVTLPNIYRSKIAQIAQRM